jgi:hypothetical protein
MDRVVRYLLAWTVAQRCSIAIKRRTAFTITTLRSCCISAMLPPLNHLCSMRLLLQEGR